MTIQYEFFTRLARIINSGQSRAIVIAGNIHDLFWDGNQYVPLIPLICTKAKVERVFQLVYELNGPIRIAAADQATLRDAWVTWKTGEDANTLAIKEMTQSGRRSQQLRDEFDHYLLSAIGNPTQALEFLRQLTICSRSALAGSLLIIIEAADMLLPSGNGDVSSLNDRQMRRISIVSDWLCDADFTNGQDSLCLVAESPSLIHARISALPQVTAIEVPAPDSDQREHYINSFLRSASPQPQLWASPRELAEFCAGLSIHSLRQLLIESAYTQSTLQPSRVISQVESFIQSQLGDDVVEFKKPEHRLKDVIGASQLKEFLHRELIPRFKARDDSALPGAAVAGPIGGGKTFIFEAVAAELDVPVLVLKSIRSQWFGQTDVIFERLRRVLEALDKVVIFVDEADTQFGRIDASAHATERRLTGKIQAMMSDPRLRGRVVWLLMTARIELLSPDIRRPGRVGDLILPVLDPSGDDRRQFIRWAIAPLGLSDEDAQQLSEQLDSQTLDASYSAAAFAALRSQFKAIKPGDVPQAIAVASDLIAPAIGATRRYQTLQALLNTTRRCLLPPEETNDQPVEQATPDDTPESRQRQRWLDELHRLSPDSL